MAKPDTVTICRCIATLLLAVAGLLICAFAFVEPVRVTVDEATLGHLGLAAPAAANGTARLAYDLALAVVVHNYNWAMHIRTTAPLDAELRFAGRLIAHFRLADGYRVHPLGKMVHRFVAAHKVEIGRDGTAELDRESAAGEFELELVVTGQFKYQAHSGRDNIRLTCPLRLAISTATVHAAFKKVQCS